MEANETISPSAYALLMMKSHTSIPFVREAAALVASQQAPPPPATSTSPAPATAQSSPSIATPAAFTAPTPASTPTTPAPANAPATDLSAGIDIDPVDYWMRVMHFESRYWTINQLLEDLTAMNILEISSGFSFRGLDLSQKKPVFYIDTDLPNIIAGKQRLIDALIAPAPPSPTAQSAHPAPTTAPTARPGHYELQPLNALDPAAFDAIVNKFPPGPLTIINEGLMVYLDHAEKAQLCANIRKALLAPPAHPRPSPAPATGSWITADIYIKRREDDAGMRSNAWRRWSEEHRLEENKFSSFEEAESFFHSMGFEIEKEATQDYSRLTSFPQFLKAVGTEGLNELRRPGRPRLHATWRLKPRP